MSKFPIRVLSELSGVPATTLRAWERRYGLLKPKRTPKGHRLYDNADLETVRQVIQLLEENHPISKAAGILRDGAPEIHGGNGIASSWGGLRKRMLRAIEAFDNIRLDAAYNEALAIYPIDIVTLQLLCPLLDQIGERWQERNKGIAEEHFFTAYLRNKLGARVHHASSRSQGRRLLLACLPGEHHELGILLFGLSALARGYRLLYLGADLPLAQVARVAGSVDIAGVLLSGTTTELSTELQASLAALADSLTIPVMIGGTLSERPQEILRSIGVHPLGSDYGHAMEHLEQLTPAYGGP
jgi:DNA-binding transcriptional MerR regulator